MFTIHIIVIYYPIWKHMGKQECRWKLYTSQRSPAQWERSHFFIIPHQPSWEENAHQFPNVIPISMPGPCPNPGQACPKAISLTSQLVTWRNSILSPTSTVHLTLSSHFDVAICLCLWLVWCEWSGVWGSGWKYRQMLNTSRQACLGRAHDSVSSNTFLLILLLPISLGCEKIKWSKINGSDVKTTMHLKCLNCLRAISVLCNNYLLK